MVRRSFASVCVVALVEFHAFVGMKTHVRRYKLQSRNAACVDRFVTMAQSVLNVNGYDANVTRVALELAQREAEAAKMLAEAEAEAAKMLAQRDAEAALEEAATEAFAAHENISLEFPLNVYLLRDLGAHYSRKLGIVIAVFIIFKVGFLSLIGRRLLLQTV
eukprot:s8137_g3.t1